MSFAENYFSKYQTNKQILSKLEDYKVGIIVVIPCYDDEAVFLTLHSLQKAIKPKRKVEVIVIVNSSEITPKNIVEKNREIYDKLLILSEKQTFDKFNLLPILVENIKKKKAGVGNARKTGMDEAVRRFNDIDGKKGIIVSLDSDCLVSENYFVEIENAFQKSKYKAFTLGFKHNFDSNSFSKQEIDACRLYEIYLRYFRLALHFTGFPHAIHTIGSCFALTAQTYCKVGGMPQLQAGEDFYFLHKVAQNTDIGQIKEQIVFPSPRISMRVPFGTGKAVAKIISEKQFLVYNFALFEILKRFFDILKESYHCQSIDLEQIPKEIRIYFSDEKLIKTFNEVKSNSKLENQFVKRIFTKFDAFWIVKFLNSFNDSEIYPKIDVFSAVNKLFYAIISK